MPSDNCFEWVLATCIVQLGMQVHKGLQHELNMCCSDRSARHVNAAGSWSCAMFSKTHA